MTSDKRLQRASRIWLHTALILFGAALRIAMLTDNRLHPDEALFATLARLIASGSDPLLANTGLLVDKPPLFYAVLAGGVSMCWGCEIAARLPGLLASVVSIALVARVASRLWGSGFASVVAAMVFALSPFAISFGATVFADPQMVMWLLAAVAAISERRVGWGGLFFGLALATKQNAIFALPLVAGIGIVQGVGDRTDWRDGARSIVRFVLPIAAVITAMVGWEIARVSEVGFWAAGVQANNPGRLIRSAEVVPRLRAWWGWMEYIGGSGWITGALVALVGVGVISEVRARANQRGAAATFVLVAFGILYWGLHWLVAFPVLDRYMLVLVPVVSLLVGRAVGLVEQQFTLSTNSKLRVATKIIMGGLVGILLTPSAITAMGSGYPIGGDHGAYDGFDSATAYLRDLPAGSVVYHSGLGWSLSYYLLDAPIVPISFDSPGALQRDLEAFGNQGAERYLIRQGWESDAEILAGAENAGYGVRIELVTRNRFGGDSFVIYRLVGASVD